MMTMPKSILASVGFDAFCHCMEAFISKIGQPLTDMMSLQGMKLIGKYLVPLYEGQCSLEAWDALSWASTLGGMVIHSAGVTCPMEWSILPAGFAILYMAGALRR